jgi:hypothetical protein
MKKRIRAVQCSSIPKPKTTPQAKPSRQYIQSLRGKYRGYDLLKELMAEKKREREL